MELVFGGARSLPSSEPQRLGQTPLSGTQGPQRLLMRLAPGRLCLPPAAARPRHRLPSWWASSDHLRVLTALRPDAPLRCAHGLCCAAGGADHRDDPPGRALVARNAPEELSRFVRTPARRMFVGPLLSLRGNSGEASCRPTWVGAASLALALRSLPRGLGKERERCSLSARRCACAALTWGASGTFRAAWP